MTELGPQYKAALMKIKEQSQNTIILKCKVCGTALVKEEDDIGDVEIQSCPRCGKLDYVRKEK